MRAHAVVGRRALLGALVALGLLSLSGCQSLCAGGRGVFCPPSSDNPLNDPPVVDGEIAAFSHLPGQPEMQFVRDRAYAGGLVVTYFVVDDPARDCSAGPPAPRTEVCPRVIADPDGDDLLLEWDFDGDGRVDLGQLAPAGDQAALFEPQSFFEGVDASYTQPGRFEARLRVSDFPTYLGAPGAATKTKQIEVHPSPREEDRGSNSPPTARFTTSPSTPYAGEPVRFDASDTHDPENHDLFYRWEFGDGTVAPHDPERPRLHRADHGIVEHAYAAPGGYTVTLSVWDSFVEEGVATQVLRVFERTPENTPPTASFSVTPASPRVGQNVTFDGSLSRDAEGPIANYEWDFDGDGSFDLDSDSDPTVTHSYESPGQRIVRLRVTDSDGATAVATRSVTVSSQPPSRAAALTLGSPFAAAAPRRLPFAATVRGRTVRGGEGRSRRRGQRLSLAGLLAGGSLRTRLLAPASDATAAERALRRFLAAPWRTRAGVGVDRASGRWSAAGVALARPRRSRRSSVCLGVRLAGAPGAHPTGVVTLLGGTGAGRRLRGAARLRFRLEANGSATALGTLGAQLGRARGLPRACRRLAR